ncbi:SPFH domain-containing protein [Carboxylicivirga sp. N1Y90]|uniref:SPFH domain-containing protein n=1 Tax=Carboxylicivirga fragile TaxID=3417571 RepID=UPI003D343DCD|nr:SPFH/Band 7/PHB domain protein [Marinilabiliaceae bacterium N1Y90]
MAVIYTVPQNHVVLIKRFGKHSRVQGEGLRFKIPFIESFKTLYEWDGTANKRGYFVELSEQQTDTPPRQCQTLDNVTIDANASIYWRITDPVKAVYDIDILPKSVADIGLNALRANIGKLKLDQLLSERQSLNTKIAAQLAESGAKWGITFTRVEIQEINYSSETAEAMMQEMTAERKKRALMAEAEGEAQAEVTRANAEANATIIRAQAKADAIRILAEAESTYLGKLKETTNEDAASQVLISQKYIDGMQAISKNPADKVYLPNNFNGLFDVSGNGK